MLLLSLPLSPRRFLGRFFFFFPSLLSSRSFLFLSLSWSLFTSLLLSLTWSPLSSPLRSHSRSSFLSFSFLSAVFLFFLCSVVSSGGYCLSIFFSLLVFSHFSSVIWCLPLVVSLCRLWLSLRLCLCLSDPFSSFIYSSGSSVPAANGVSGVATSALGDFGLCVFTGCFSLVPVPEIHWLLSDIWAFLDTDDTFLLFCLRSQDPFSLVLLPSLISSHGICCILQATMDVSLPSFVG